MIVKGLRMAGPSIGLAVLAAVAMVASAPGPARAAPMTATWTGNGANSNWGTAANWDIGVPAPGDTLVFPAAANRKTNINNLPMNTTFEEIRIEGGDYFISGNRIILTDVFRNDPGMAADTTILLTIDGDATVRQETGRLKLLAENSYAGNTIVNGGELLVGHTLALGESSSTLDIYGGTVTFLEPGAYFQRLFIGGATASVAALNDIDWRGQAQLFGGAEFYVQNGTTFEISGVMSGGGLPLKTGGGTLELSGANTFAGVLGVSQGILHASHNKALGSAADGVVVSDGAVLELSGDITIEGELIQLDGMLHNLSGINTLDSVITGGDAEVMVTGGVLRLSDGLDQGGPGHVVEKWGAGILELEGNGTFAGTFEVYEGWLTTRGNVLAKAVIDGGELRGNGRIGAVTGLDGYIVPGSQGAGTLFIDGFMTLSPATTVEYMLNSAVSHTSLRVSGAIQLNDAVLYVDGPGNVPQGVSATLLENTGAGAINGTFAFRPGGSTLAVGGNFFSLTYAGGPPPANDFVLSRLTADVDIQVSMTGNPTSAPNVVYDYSIRAQNLGQTPVGATLLRVVIPQGATYVAAQGAVCSHIGDDAQGATYHCSLPSVPTAPEFRSVVITAAITAGAGSQVTFRASIEPLPGEPAANNSAEKTVAVAVGGLGFRMSLPGVARDGSW